MKAGRVFFVFMISIVLVWAGDFWAEKDYTAWTQKECETLLTKSPWVFSNSLFEAENFTPLEAAGRISVDRTISFRFRLLSAKPIRMAFGRLQLLQKPNDSSTAERVAGIIEAPADPSNRIVVQIEVWVTPPSDPSAREIYSSLLRANLTDFRDTVLSSSNKVTIRVIEYRAPRQNQPNPVFIFPRFDEKGAPYFTGSEKWVSIRTEIFGYSIYARNSAEKMKFRGAFEL